MIRLTLTTLAASLLAAPLMAQTELRVALDWTPNTNHVGLYVAEAEGFYDEAGLDVEILPYTDTSASTLIANGVAQFGILSSLSLFTQGTAGADLKATYAVVQHETGRLVFDGRREDIQTPADLDGKIYAGFGSNWEEALKLAWTDMVVLLCHLYDTNAEHANLIVGTIADAVPGFAAGNLFGKGYKNENSYVTCQLSVTKELRRTGEPFKP